MLIVPDFLPILPYQPALTFYLSLGVCWQLPNAAGPSRELHRRRGRGEACSGRSLSGFRFFFAVRKTAVFHASSFVVCSRRQSARSEGAGTDSDVVLVGLVRVVVVGGVWWLGGARRC